MNIPARVVGEGNLSANNGHTPAKTWQDWSVISAVIVL